MRGHLRKFTRDGGTVRGPCMGTGATKKACLQNVKHRNYVGSDRDRKFIENLLAFILMTFSEQILSEESNILEVNEVQVAPKAYLKILIFDESARSISIWKSPISFSTAQSIPSYVAQFPSQYHFDTELFEKVRHMRYTIWSDKWLTRLIFHANALRAQDCLI